MGFLKRIFIFKNKERKGIISLLVITIILIIIRATNILTYKHPECDYSDIENKVKEFEFQLSEKEKSKNKIQKGIDNYSETIEYFSFDPNLVSFNNLKKLGFSVKQAKTIINYRKAGGVFREKEDLKKIYSVSDKKYKELEAYIDIKPTKQIVKSQNEKEYVKVANQQIEINKTDSITLLSLHGIGPVFSQRIIKYRDLLGGFYNKEQLKEVYGLNDSLYQFIHQYITIDTINIHKINLNATDYNQLNKHPYISKYNAQAILKYIQLIGKVSNKKELIDNEVLERDDFNKICIYLDAK